MEITDTDYLKTKIDLLYDIKKECEKISQELEKNVKILNGLSECQTKETKE